MSYSKQIWRDYDPTNSPLSAERFNHMEDGIEDATDAATDAPINVLHPPNGLAPMVPGQDSTAALAAIVAALPSTGGELYFPAQTADYLATNLDLKGKRSIILRGGGGRGVHAAGHGTQLCLTGGVTFDRLVDCRETAGVRFRDMQVFYNSSAFVGTFMDWANDSGSAANDTHGGGTDNCLICGNNASSAKNASELLGLQNVHTLDFNNTEFLYAQRAAKGKDDANDYSNNVSFNKCLFWLQSVAHLYNADDWSCNDCTFQPLENGKCGIYRHDAGIRYRSLHFKDGWVGDIIVDTTGEPHIEAAGNNLHIEDGVWKLEHASGKFIVVDENDCEGINIDGGDWTGPGSPIIDYGVTTGHQRVRVIPGGVTNIAAIENGTIPEGRLRIDDSGHLLIGADVELFRGGVDELKTMDQFTVERGSAAAYALAARVTGDAQTRWAMNVQGEMEWGNSAAARDTFLKRNGAGVLRLAGNAAGTAGGAFQFTPMAAASAPNNSIFMDSVDNVLKRKDNAGAVAAI